MKCKYMYVAVPTEEEERKYVFCLISLNNFFLLQFWSSNTVSVVLFSCRRSREVCMYSVMLSWGNWEKEGLALKVEVIWYLCFTNKYIHTSQEYVYVCISVFISRISLISRTLLQMAGSFAVTCIAGFCRRIQKR